jgi:hypothetical protein
VVGLELLGIYQNIIGAGDVVEADGQTRSANRGFGTGGVDVTFAGKPMRNTLMFLDLDAASGTPSIAEAWLSVAGPKQVFSGQVGLIDLGGTFDSNKVANDETSQFLSDIFVNSPLLMNPSGLGAVLRADSTRYNFAVGAQDTKGSSADVFDDLYWIAEAGMRFNLLGDSHWRVWARQQPRGDGQPDQAVGLSADHRLSTKLTAFGRYSKNSYVESYTPEDLANAVAESRVAVNQYDWSGSGGFELAHFLRSRLNDKAGLAWGRTDEQGGASEQYGELYYKLQLTGNLGISLHGQGTFSRVVAPSDPALLDPTVIDPVTGLPGDPTLNDARPNQWTAGIRVLASY